MDDLVVPEDREAEMSTLGGMMLSKSVVFDVLGIVAPDDFYQPRHEVIFRAIADIVSDGEPVDVISVSDRLQKTGLLGQAGGAEYLHTLTAFVPSPGSSAVYASIVRDKAVLRRLVEAGIHIQQMGYASEGTPAELAERARAELDLAASSTLRAEVDSIGSSFDALVDSMGSAPTYVLTPWRELNTLVGGLRAGALYVIGARPGDGKTIMGLQIAQELAQRGAVAFSSLEMSTDQLLTRLIASRGAIHLTPLTNGTLSGENLVKVASMRHEVRALPLFIDDRSGVNITQIKAFARSVSRKGKISGVVVDYLQLVTGADKRMQRWEVVGEISRQLKILARELKCPVIALSQLNRDPAKGRRRPTLADLRESGSIEQDADVVFLLEREVDKDGIETGQIWVHVAKNRHGMTGSKSLKWEGQFARLSSQSWGAWGRTGEN